MRKNILVIILLMSYPTFAQVSSGTSIVFNLAKDKIVIAADSGLTLNNVSAPNNPYCKIMAFRHQFIFTTSGVPGVTRGFSNSGPWRSWDSTELAGEIIRRIPKEEVGNSDALAIAADWAEAARANWIPFCAWNRRECVDVSQKQHGQLIFGVFIKASGLSTAAATVGFDMWDFNDPVKKGVGTIGNCWQCGQNEGERVCAAGSHTDLAAQICSERKPGSKISVHTALTGVDDHVKLAVEIVEKTIEVYEKTGDVSGPVDAVTLTKDGRITWNAIKPNCQENQD